MSFKETVTHGNTNCHKNAQERIWDSSRTMAHSLPLCSATHPFPRADEGTDNTTRWIDNCIEVRWIISILSSPFLNNLPSLSIKFQLFLLLLPLLWAAASVNFCLCGFLPCFLLAAAVGPGTVVCPCHRPEELGPVSKVGIRALLEIKPLQGSFYAALCPWNWPLEGPFLISISSLKSIFWN